MSNRIRYDSLLVRYLAEELDERLSGRRLDGLRLDPERRAAALVFGEEALVWPLHPAHGAPRLGPPPDFPDVVRLPRRTTVKRIHSPPDERLIWFELTSPRLTADRPHRLAVELLTNQWNLIGIGRDGRVVAVLWRRTAGGRRLVRGAPYDPPPRSARRGSDGPLDASVWRALLAPVQPPERAGVLLREVAYTSPLNAPAILGVASIDDSPDALDAAWERYAALASFPPPAPMLLELDGAPQPYPLPLQGVPGRRCNSLLEAFAAAAASEAVPVLSPVLLDRLRRRLARAERARDRLTAELAGAADEAAALRRRADLLLSRLDVVGRGESVVELDDFDGGRVRIELDPSLSPVENANALYAEARKRERASERLPALIQRAEADVARLAELLARAEAGTADPAEVEAAAGEPAEERKGRPSEEPPLPYRRYRTSGGLEVRVGRGSRANDALTFHHSSPNDIWLHARDVAGAHVVLRWGDADSNPPARDLTEAAVLAALHSRARTSGTVAVDWTRRKYVRKPRKAPPGLVIPERGRTLFVEPDPALEERMRW